MHERYQKPACSTRVKHMRWWSLGVPKCVVRVMSVVPQSYCPPESSSSRVLPSTCTHRDTVRPHPHQGVCRLLASVAFSGVEQGRGRSRVTTLGHPEVTCPFHVHSGMQQESWWQV